MENENLFKSQEEALKAQFDEMERLEREIGEHLDLRKKEESQIVLNEKVLREQKDLIDEKNQQILSFKREWEKREKRVAGQNSILYENEKNIKKLDTNLQNWDRVQIHLDLPGAEQKVLRKKLVLLEGVCKMNCLKFLFAWLEK